MGKNLLQSPEFRGKASGRRADRYDLTVRSDMRIVSLVAPNGSERSEMLGSRKHGANRLLSVRGLCCVRLVVWVLFVNSIVCLFVFLCLFFVFECFWLGLLTGFSGWFFWALTFLFLFGEFDPGSGRTLAACLTHASRTLKPSLLGG